jgi:hypothetical protein
MSPSSMTRKAYVDISLIERLVWTGEQKRRPSEGNNRDKNPVLGRAGTLPIHSMSPILRLCFWISL